MGSGVCRRSMNVHGEGRGSDAYVISGGRALQPNPDPAQGKYIVDGTPESHDAILLPDVVSFDSFYHYEHNIVLSSVVPGPLRCCLDGQKGMAASRGRDPR